MLEKFVCVFVDFILDEYKAAVCKTKLECIDELTFYFTCLLLVYFSCCGCVSDCNGGSQSTLIEKGN